MSTSVFDFVSVPVPPPVPPLPPEAKREEVDPICLRHAIESPAGYHWPSDDCEVCALRQLAYACYRATRQHLPPIARSGGLPTAAYPVDDEMYQSYTGSRMMRLCADHAADEGLAYGACAVCAEEDRHFSPGGAPLARLAHYPDGSREWLCDEHDFPPPHRYPLGDECECDCDPEDPDALDYAFGDDEDLPRDCEACTILREVGEEGTGDDDLRLYFDGLLVTRLCRPHALEDYGDEEAADRAAMEAASRVYGGANA